MVMNWHKMAATHLEQRQHWCCTKWVSRFQSEEHRDPGRKSAFDNVRASYPGNAWQHCPFLVWFNLHVRGRVSAINQISRAPSSNSSIFLITYFTKGRKKMQTQKKSDIQEIFQSSWHNIFHCKNLTKCPSLNPVTIFTPAPSSIALLQSNVTWNRKENTF